MLKMSCVYGRSVPAGRDSNLLAVHPPDTIEVINAMHVIQRAVWPRTH